MLGVLQSTNRESDYPVLTSITVTNSSLLAVEDVYIALIKVLITFFTLHNYGYLATECKIHKTIPIFKSSE